MNRIREIDMMKGLVILEIIMIHLWRNAAVFLENTHTQNFSLAALFLLSGYFMSYQPFAETLKKRIFQILRPFLKYYIGIVCICGGFLLVNKEITWMELFRAALSELLGKELLELIVPGFYLRCGLHRPLTVTWFFVQLCLATVITVILLRFCEGQIKKLYAAIVTCLVLSAMGYHFFGNMPLQLQMTFFEAALMIIGYCVRVKSVLQQIGNMSDVKKVTGIVAGIVLLWVIDNWNPGISYMARGQIGSRGAIDVFTATAHVLIGSYSVYLFFGYLSGIQIVEKALSFVGRHSLDYAMLHMPIAWLAYRLFNIPIAIDYVQTDTYSDTLFNYFLLGAICISNVMICTFWIRIREKAAGYN